MNYSLYATSIIYSELEKLAINAALPLDATHPATVTVCSEISAKFWIDIE